MTDIRQVLGFSGSPRKNGNTDLLVQSTLESVAERGASVEFIRISELKIEPCDACWTCADNGECHFDDDMQPLYTKLAGSNGVVIGSPVHMGYSISGQAQVFLDRTFALWHHKKLRDKIGGCIAVSNRRGGINTMAVLSGAMHSHQMIIAGHANGYGLAPGDVKKDTRALKEASLLGKRLWELKRMIRI